MCAVALPHAFELLDDADFGSRRQTLSCCCSRGRRVRGGAIGSASTAAAGATAETVSRLSDNALWVRVSVCCCQSQMDTTVSQLGQRHFSSFKISAPQDLATRLFIVAMGAAAAVLFPRIDSGNADVARTHTDKAVWRQ